ncbi:LysR family transcriptional regulator [Scatolibacter rhodanostii]|uniref:LysR family transcriptional regulator n=1 Tax=Scatolibacter rhodanostii TaxID=2014781 RepID=UPI000C07589E|nr:LysR family transcriptional regulator [Scatolibacter rhodanostii]
MNTIFFKYVIEVERTRSITQAAENLFMAQPNLSKAIKEIEESLGFAIFKRTSKGVIPTPKGNEFLDYARNIASQLDKIDSLSKPKEAGSQSFNISIPRGSYISHAFIHFVEELNREEEINLNLQETNAMTTIDNVATGRFDLGVIRYQTAYERYFLDFLKDKQLCHESIWEFEYLVLMSKDSLLAKEPQVEHPYLDKLTEIIHGDNVIPYLSANGESLPQHSGAGKKKIYLYERCNQFELLSAIPDTYMWVSPIPKDYLMRYRLIQRPCSVQGNQYRDILVYAKGYQFTDLDRKFIDKLYQTKDEVAKMQE